MSKKSKTLTVLFRKNQKRLSKFYYRYIFLIIISMTILIGILFYKLDAHIVLFGDTPSALGEYVKTMATVLGGALVLLGLWINNRRVAEQIRQNNIAEKGQINTRFKDAATLLGSENVSSILSGVYALHQIASESSVGDEMQRGYVRIIHDILCAYVRENTETIVKEDDGREWRVNSKPTIVIQTIVKVLFKNNEFIYSDLMTDLSNCIFEDIDFDNAYFANVDFSKTKFIRSKANGCSFISCYLENTFVDDMDFSGSSFDKVVFDNSHIKNTSFNDVKFQECDFWDAILFKTTFENAKFSRVDFKGAIFEEGVLFRGSSFAKFTLDEIVSDSLSLTKD